MADSQAQDITSPAYRIMLSNLLDEQVPAVSITKATQLKDQVTLLDAREKAEFEVSHLPGAQWIGFDDFSQERLADLPKSKPIIVYCSVGYRSQKITQKLRKWGYSAKNLYGGLFEWVNQGHPIVNKKGSETDSVHAYSRIWGVWLNRGTKVFP
jgi:rhodanese-related sulfurtransferase